MQMDVSLVVSVYNEEQALPSFWHEVQQVIEDLDCLCEVIFVNDGSDDDSLSVLQQFVASNSHVSIVNLSRNFGHEAAMLAGIDYSCGQAVICLDADLQHPPKLIPQMIESHRAGNLIVHMVRDNGSEAGWCDRLKSIFFYRLLNLISPQGFTVNASDFFLIDRTVCELLKKEFRERTRFLRGIIQTVGFQRATLSFNAPSRTAGESKYSFFQLLNLSITALATFSKLPLRFGLLLGVVCGVSSAGVGFYSLIMKALGDVVTGYTTIVVLISFLFSVQLIILGIIGEYTGFLFEEVKRRPIYILESLIDNENSRSD